jgi:uncharacterized membrane protein YccF (DUF307 family)
VLKLIGNIIWLLLGGLWAAVGYAIAGLILLLPIITIPFAIQAFKLARYTLWPFGSRLVPAVESPVHGVLAILGNIIWFVLVGIWMAIFHVVAALLNAITIIGLPFAWAHLKLAGVSLVPFGFRVVDEYEAAALGASGGISVQRIG